MFIIDKYGNKAHIDDESIPENTEMSNFVYSDVYMYPDDTILKECYTAEVVKENWQKRGEYEYLGQQEFDHYPTKDEILYLLAKFGAGRIGYVSVHKIYKMDSEDDED